MVMIKEEGEDDDGTEQSDTEYLKNHWKTKKIKKNPKKQSTVPKKQKKKQLFHNLVGVGSSAWESKT